MMPFVRTLLRAALPVTLLAASPLLSQSPPGSSSTPTFRATSSLVFLDVTVIDAKGNVVTSGLTKDDFTITENNQPQRIFSFEAPKSSSEPEHSAASGSDEGPLTILILDQLNSGVEGYQILNEALERYLNEQPETLAVPTELMVAGNRSSELVQGFTRNRNDLLFALKHVPVTLPYKSAEEQFFQSMQTLQAIALQSKGLYRRKNVLWIGSGAPEWNLAQMNQNSVPRMRYYIQTTVNMLVDARMTLFQIFPGNLSLFDAASIDSRARLRGRDPFGGDINFGVLVNETGGKLFDDNFPWRQIAKSIQFGAEYYTLTYQPHDAASYGKQDGAFRSIQVSPRDPSLRVITKGGYYAPDQSTPLDPQQKAITEVSDAAQVSVPFDGLAVKFANVVRHGDSRSVEFTMLVKSKNVDWEPAENGSSHAVLIFAAVCSSPSQQILASKLQGEMLTVNSQDATTLANQNLRVTMIVRFPRDARNLRVAVETQNGGRIGAANLDRKTIDAAPNAPTPQPKIAPRRGGL